MFKSKGFVRVFVIEMVFPWLILIGGIPANYCYLHHSEWLEFFWSMAMITGVVSLLIESVIGLTAFLLMILCLIEGKKEKYSVSRNVVIWLCSGLCIFGTVALMLLVQGITYALSV